MQRNDRGFEAGRPFGITAAFATHRELELGRPRVHPTVLPIRILQLCTAANLHLSLGWKCEPSAICLGVCLLTAEAGELKLDAGKKSKNRHMLNAPFRAFRNGKACLAIGYTW